MMKKALKLDLKYFDEDGTGTFEGYGSTFDNMDRVGDVVEQGAFARSLENHRKTGTAPAMLLHHDMSRPIGKWLEFEEDSKGLYVKGKLTRGVRDADEAYALLKDGVIESLSIGYIVEKETYDHFSGKNHLNEIALHEISLVTIPANQQAMISSVKGVDGEPDIRALESVLREAGLSRREAKAVLADGFKTLSSGQDVIHDLLEDAINSEIDSRVEKHLRLAKLKAKLEGIQCLK